MPLTPRDVAEMVSDLVSLPEACDSLNRLVEDPSSTTESLARAIMLDPALSTRVLRLVNSPMFGLSRRIDNIHRAITILGRSQIRDLALSAVAVQTFSGIPEELVDIRSFWQHSVYTAIVTRLMAGRAGVEDVDRLFLAGLMHDVGKLAMYGVIPELVEVIMTRYKVWVGPLYQAELSILGFHHGEVGAELMRLWRLPEAIASLIEWHHDPAPGHRYARDTALLHLANNLTHTAGLSGTRLEAHPEVCHQAWDIAGLSSRLSESISIRANAEFEHVAACLISDSRPLSAA